MKHKKYKLLVLESLALSSILFTNSLTINHRSIVSYNTYNEGNTTNLVLNKILSDNELKQEIPHMFNYASNGNYFDISSYEDKNNPDYITEGLYSREDEDGTTYYYRGDVDNNNFVFGAYDEDYYVYYSPIVNLDRYYQSIESCQEDGNSRCTPVKLASAGDKMYWKIVRINGDSSIRLIYNGPGLNDLKLGAVEVSFNEEEISGVVGAVPYNLNFNYPKYTGYTYDNGTDSFIKKEVDTWYNNTLGKNNDYDQYVILGRFCSDSSGYNYDGRGNFASYDRLGQRNYDSVKDNTPTFICPETTESYGGSYKLKAGLITADELVFAGESLDVLGNSYLNSGKNGDSYWTMTPFRFDDSDGGYVFTDNGSLSYYEGSINDYYALRPVINIKTEGMTLVGEGTSDNPYYLEKVENNNYEGVITIEEGSSSDIPPAFQEDVPLNIDITWTSDDESISKIEDNKILGLKEGQTIIRGVSSDGLTNYLIRVTVIKNPVTMSNIYLVMGITLILGLATITYGVYRKKREEV